MKEIKKIAPRSLANISGAVYFFFGFIFGLFMFVISIIAGAEGETARSLWFGIGALVLIPLAYGAAGWLGGYLSAFIYNFFAKKVGGIKIELD